MSLTIEFNSHVAARLHLWADGLDIPGETPVEWYVASLFLELFALDWQHPNSPYSPPKPEWKFAAAAETMIDSFLSSFLHTSELSQREGDTTEAATMTEEPANDAQEISVELPASVQPTTLTLEFSPAAENLITTEAQARGLSASEYLNTIAERLIDLADLVTPTGMTFQRDPANHYEMPVEEILNQSIREMKESQIRNREYAVQAITQKNNLQAEVDKEERMLAEYRRKALQALDDGNRPLAEQFYKERLRHEQTCEIMRGLLVQATDIAEKVKERIKHEEERIRVRTSKALLLKANLAASVIAFHLDMLQEEMQEPDTETFRQNFDAWVQAQKSPHAD